MSSPNHASANSASESSATAQPNENGVSHSSEAVRKQETSSSDSTSVVNTVKENGSSKDESTSLQSDMQTISLVSQTEDTSQANAKLATCPPKFTQQLRDQSIDRVAATQSEEDRGVEGNKPASVSAAGPESNDAQGGPLSHDDTRTTPLNTQMQTNHTDNKIGTELEEQGVQAISAPLQQLNVSNSTGIIEQGNSTILHTPIVEGTPVLRVMGVPAGDTTVLGIPPATIENVTQSQVSLVHTIVAPEGATVVGMVGTTPIVRLPETSKRVVTKKRGRFKVFQPVIDVAPVDSTAGSPSVAIESPAVNAPNQPVTGGQEAIDGGPLAAKHIHQPPLPLSNQEELQTFEGTGAPVVKRKGRFFVTNLKDPGLISVNINPQAANGVPGSAIAGNQATVESYQVTSTYVQTNPPTVVVAPGPSDSYHSAALLLNNGSVTSSSVPMLQQQQIQYSVVQQDHPAVYVQAPYFANPNTQYAVEPQQSAFSQPSVNLPTGAEGTNLQSRAEPAEPKVRAPERPDSGADHRRDHSETPQSYKLLAHRYPSVPKSARDEHVAPSGLGKVFHFLDQMRTEVAQADKMIKTLQGDTRLLKEKNKELEAKVIDAERRYREEKALREAAEGKLKALRKKVRSMREGSDAQREDENILTSAKRPEDIEPGQSRTSPVATERSSIDVQRTKSPVHDPTKKESHILPATPDTNKNVKSTSPENIITQSASAKALPPTPPVSRRKGSSSSNVPVPKPSPSHSRVHSTPHIPSHTGLLNNGFSNQIQTLYSGHAPHVAGSAQPGAQRFTSTDFDPLAPKNAATPEQETVAPTDKPENSFDPFRTGLQYTQSSAIHAMQPASLFVMNQNNMTVAAPIHIPPGSSFESLDHMTMKNQPRIQPFDQSQIPALSSSAQEMQQHVLEPSNFQESQQPVLLVPQQNFELYVESQVYPNPNQLASGSGMNTSVAQNTSTSGLWSQQQQGPDGAPSPVSSRLSMSSDPFDELLNRTS